MHTLVTLFGLLLDVFGGACLLLVGHLICNGTYVNIAEEHRVFSSRSAMAFELLPVPLGLVIGGWILARWGFVGI